MFALTNLFLPLHEDFLNIFPNSYLCEAGILFTLSMLIFIVKPF